MIEALFFRKIADGKVQCLLCPHLCTLSGGKAGKCGVRRNVNASLVTEIYGKMSAIHFDPIEKKPLYHFHPGNIILSIGSIGCNLSCSFCQNCNISQADVSRFPWLKDHSPDEIVQMAASHDSNLGIAFTYNEPTISGDRFGTMTWSEWKEMNEEMVKIIRKEHAEALVLVAGFNWAYDLIPIKEDPVDAEGIAYVSHPYPEKRKAPWEDQWEADWGFVTKKYPVILTEIGFALPEEKGVHIPVHGDETYGKALVDFTKKRGISWVVWCFDPNWSPFMYTDWDYTPTRQGAFFKKVMTGD